MGTSSAAVCGVCGVPQAGRRVLVSRVSAAPPPAHHPPSARRRRRRARVAARPMPGVVFSRADATHAGGGWTAPTLSHIHPFFRDEIAKMGTNFEHVVLEGALSLVTTREDSSLRYG